MNRFYLFHKTTEIVRNSHLYFKLEYRRFVKSYSRDSASLNKRTRFPSAGPSGILVVIPSNEKNSSSLTDGIFTEIFLTLSEEFSEEVRKFEVLEDMYWHDDLIEKILDFNPRAILIDGESNPSRERAWDSANFAFKLSQVWEGYLILVSTDSVWKTHLFRLKLVLENFPRASVIAIDRFVPKHQLDSKKVFGPTVLPISKQTVNQADFYSSKNKDRKPGLLFVGSLHENRRKFLDDIQRSNLIVYINPLQSNERMPNYKFLSVFSDYTHTLNFSFAHKHKKRQIKSRILEAAIFGSIILTDEKMSSNLFPEIQHLIKVVNFNKPLDISATILDSVTRNELAYKARSITRLHFIRIVESILEIGFDK